MNKQSIMLIIALLVAFSSSSSAHQLPSKIKVIGNISVRSPHKVGFVKIVDDFIDSSNGLILKSQSSFKNKLATDTKVLIGSYTITMFPGAMFKIIKSGIKPMIGRFDIKNINKNTPSISFSTSKFSCEFCHGQIVIEMCPNGDSYIASPKQVKSWVKEMSRKIHVLEAGTEIFFPAFGPPKIKNIISPRWSQSPAGYANIDRAPSIVPNYENATKTESLTNTSSQTQTLSATSTISVDAIASDTSTKDFEANENDINQKIDTE